MAVSSTISLAHVEQPNHNATSTIMNSDFGSFGLLLMKPISSAINAGGTSNAATLPLSLTFSVNCRESSVKNWRMAEWRTFRSFCGTETLLMTSDVSCPIGSLIYCLQSEDCW